MSYFLMNLFQYSIELRITKNNNATAIPNFDNNLNKSLSKNKKIKATAKIIRNSPSKKEDFFDITYDEIYPTTLDTAQAVHTISADRASAAVAGVVNMKILAIRPIPQIAQTPSQNSLPVTSPP